ncbi:cysteine hydrolase family protein [Lysinibacillus sp. OL1_EC]|uniref:cysteine hydrolase family protein n=1 Tax=unclassified Lysinibacillus TaxID=2636778 RepID=UPI00202F05FE|nr:MULTISPECIES: cysteine hydrolase family protein [unclassified Lysinibacillus]MCM0624493.1 cysteine hydrolase family protein [Lysinibacillus sp. OL1_EC]
MYEENKELDNVIYSSKKNYNAFFQTGLAEKLRDLGTEKVHIVVTTDICDFLTVAGADAEGFKTIVHKRGVATFTNLQATILDHMKCYFHTEIIE